MQVIDLGIIAGGAILIGLSDAESNITAEMVAGGTAIALALISMLYEIIMNDQACSGDRAI